MRRFISLEWKKFFRSKNLTQNLFKKIFVYLGIILTGLYISALIIGSYFILQKEFPGEDIFKKTNQFIYILFFLLLYILSFTSSSTFDVRPFMILPLRKSKIINYYIFKVLFNPFNLIIVLDLLILSLIFIKNHYQALPVFIWFLSLIAVIFIINLILLLFEKNQYFMALSSLLLLILVTNSDKIKGVLEPLGNYFYLIYKKPYHAIPVFVLALAIYFFSYYFFRNKFYLDAEKSTPQKKKFSLGKWNPNLDWTERYGKTGTFIKNDIRLITRNPRTKQLLYSAVFMVIFGVVILMADMYKDNKFMIIYWAFLLTGYFIISYGALIPSWDGKYYKLLMSQNIKYKEYLEAKWWFMVVSVVFMTIISLPLIFLYPDFLGILLSMAILNIGFHTYAVLFTGLLNKKAIDLDQKVKAFQNNQDFNGKIFVFGMLRLIIPVTVFFVIKEFFNIYYAFLSISIIGFIGILMKNYLLKKIAVLYEKRKYELIESFSAEED